MPKTPLANQEIIVGVTGSIAAYKAAEIVSFLTQHQARVTVIMTQAATQLIRPLTFQTLSHNQVYTELFNSRDSFSPEHIALTDKADAVLIAPATANIIGKIAHGIADDLLSSLVMAVRVPVLLAPAMNDKMYRNPIVQENIAFLKKHNYRFIEPEKGYLACQKKGVGRMAQLAKIIKALESALIRKV